MPATSSHDLHAERDARVLHILHRLSPNFPRGVTPEGSTELRSLGLDSMALVELFIELEESCGVATASLRKVLHKKCTYGEVRALVR